MLNEELNLKTDIRIGADDYTLELFSIEKGKITEIKLNNNVYSKNNGQDHNISDEDPGVSPEKHEQNTPIIEPIPEKPVKKDKKIDRYNSWTKKENQILIDNYKKFNISKIVEKKLLPGRTKNAVAKKKI